MATQNLMDELDDGVHDVEMTIEIDFKFPQEDPSQKSQFKFGGKGPKPTKVRDRFAVIYELPNGNEVRSDSISRTNPRWVDKRTCRVDMDMLLDFYEKPMDFALYRMAQMGAAPTTSSSSYNQPAQSTQLQSINDESEANLNVNDQMSSRAKTPGGKPDSMDRRREMRRQSLQHLQQRIALIARHGRRHLSRFSSVRAQAKPHHYDSAEKMIRASTPRRSADMEEKEKLYQTSAFVPSKEKLATEEKEGSPDVLDLNADLRPKTPPQPHHFDAPEKHAYEHFEEELERQRSREKTSAGGQRPPSANRPTSASRPKSSSNGSAEIKKKIESSSFNVKDPSMAQMSRDSDMKSKVRTDFLQFVTNIRLDNRIFYWDCLSTEAQCQQHVAGVESVTVRVSLNHPLLSRSQHEKLNPMCITVSSAEVMPDQPLSWSELQQKFKPAYVKLKFFDVLNENTAGLSQTRKLAWNSKHVLLTGTFDQVKFKQQLLNEKIEFEVHDRDEVTEIAMEEDTTSPCGIASTSLADLVLDNKECAKFSLPILPKQMHIMEDQRKISKTPQGQWLQAKTTLKTKVELAYPLLLDDADIEQYLLKATEQLSLEQGRGSTPSSRARSAEISALMQRRQLKGGKYARAAIYFRDLEVPVFKSIFNKIVEVNMRALGFDPESSLDRRLFEDYRLSPEERQAIYDIITGCHIYDSKNHWVFVEGLPQNGLQVFLDFIAAISEKCPGMRVFHAERDDARGLFPYRMWTQIYSDILHLKLNEDLECILGRGSTYKTTGRSRESYDALQIMLELMTCPDYATFFKKQLLVTNAMIKCLLNNYAKMILLADMIAYYERRNAGKTHAGRDQDARKLAANTRPALVPNRASTKNPDYEMFLKEYAGRELNFIRLNQCRYPDWCEPMERSYETTVFNYSVQARNTAEVAKQQICERLADRYPNHLFELNGRTFPIGEFESRRSD